MGCERLLVQVESPRLMFDAPEGRKLFVWTKARRALEKAKLFMSPQDWEILHAGNAAYNQKVEDILDERVKKGWKPSKNKIEREKELRQMEDDASLWVEQNIPGYLPVFNKLDSLFGSALDVDPTANG